MQIVNSLFLVKGKNLDNSGFFSSIRLFWQTVARHGVNYLLFLVQGFLLAKRYLPAFLFLAVLIFISHTLSAQTAQTLPYTQDFSALLWSSSTYPNGWQGYKINNAPGLISGAPFAVLWIANIQPLGPSGGASNSSKGIYNFNGKIGWVAGTGGTDVLLLAIETTGKTNIQVQYDIMTIRNPPSPLIEEVTLQYRIGTTGNFTTITGIEYQNPTSPTEVGVGVTTPINQTTKTYILPSACENKAVVHLRWMPRLVSTGAISSTYNPGFAIDNVSVRTCTTPPAPTVTSPKYYCSGVATSPLTATGSGLLWYTVATGGVGNASAPIPSTNNAGITSYYVSQTVLGCEGPRAQIDVVVNSSPMTSVIYHH